MKQEQQVLRANNRRQALDRLCSVSALVLSIACSIALFHLEFRIQEQRLNSDATTICDKMQKEILRKVRRDLREWGDEKGDNKQNRKGTLV